MIYGFKIIFNHCLNCLNCLDEYISDQEVPTETSDPRRNYFVVSSLKDVPVKTLLIIGKTGTGKSALCNRISGQKFDSDIFPVSGEATSCTQNTTLGLVNFNGDHENA